MGKMLSDDELDAQLGIGQPTAPIGKKMMSDEELDAHLGMNMDIPLSPKPKNSKYDKVDSFLEGAGQGLTMGYANNMRAGSEKPITSVMNTLAKSKMIADMLGIPQNPDVVPDDYVESRDKFNQVTEDKKKANPKTYMGGQIGGAVLGTVAMPTAKLLKAPTVMGRIGKNAAFGGGMGALANPGDIEGDVGDLQLGDRLKNAGIGAVMAAGLTGLAETGLKGYDLIKEFIKRNPKASTQEIEAAAAALGIEPTPGMVQGKGIVPQLESSLEQSPTLFGRMVAKDKNKVLSKLKESAEDVVGDQSTKTPFQLGEEVKAGISTKVSQRKDPLSNTFEELKGHTSQMELPQKSIESYSKNIQNIPGFKMVPKAEQYVGMLKDAKTGDDLKTIMTYINEDIRATRGMEKIILGQVKDKLSNFEKHNVFRAAKDAGDPAVAGQIMSDLKGARKGWGEMMSDLSDVSQKTRMQKPKGPSEFLDNLEMVPSEKVADKLFTPDNKAALDAVKKQFPEQYELMRQGKLSDLAESAQYKGDLSPHRLVKQTDKMNPEGLLEVFGNKADKLGNIKTLVNSLPENINPSGTSINQSFQGGWVDNALRHAKDASRYGAYKFLGSDMADKAANVMSSTNPTAFQKLGENALPLTGAAMQGRVKNDRATDDRLRGQLPDVISMVEKNPALLQRINNQRLREVIQKGIEKKRKIPTDAIQKDFIENN